MTFIPVVRQVADNQLTITVGDITEAMAENYTVIRVYTDTDENGTFSTLDGTVTLVANTTEYTYYDGDGTSSDWYKCALYGASASPTETAKGTAVANGTVADGAYCSSFDIRQELAAGGGTANATSEKYGHALWEMIIQASRLIDRFKRVEPKAYRATASAARTFWGSGSRQQAIDPAVSVSAVAVDESASGSYTSWTSTDYNTWPYNASATSEPITRLEVSDLSSTTKSVFTRGQKRVQVTAVWGVASTPPAEISRACRIQAARWYKRAQQAWQDTSANANLGTMLFTQELDPDIRTILRYTYPHTGGTL